tara:strand:- start:4971 stop:6113 length:1143 start_codon:yes stop_codon:yes gene_type:complete
MLKKRRIPPQKRKSLPGNKKKFNSSEPPEWVVTSQLRKSYFKPEESVPTRIRVIPRANGDLFYEYYQAWVKANGRNSAVISNAWNGQRELPCMLFDKYSETYENGGDASMYEARRYQACTVVVLEHFYKIERQGKSGPYYIYKQAPSPNRYGQVVEDPEFEGCPKVFGRVLHWSMYNRQREEFEKNLEQALGMCINCKEGQVEAVKFSCPNCANVYGDIREHQIPAAELKFLKSGKKLGCTECDHEDPPLVEHECVVQKGYGSSARYEKGCDNPTKAEAGQPIDLVIRKVPAGTSYSIEILDVDIPQDIPELPSMQENPKISTSEPMDFDRFFGRMKLRDQAFALTGDANSCPYGDDLERLIDEYFAAAPDEEDADSIPF